MGRKTETDPPKSVFVTNDPPPTNDLIGSDPVRTFGWVRSSDWMDNPSLNNVILPNNLLLNLYFEKDRKSVV